MKLICKIDGFDVVIGIIDNILAELHESSNKSDEWIEGFTAFGNTLKNALMKMAEDGDNE